MGQTAGSVELKKFILTPDLVCFTDEERQEAVARTNRIKGDPKSLAADEVSRLREMYGGDFLTAEYWLELES